MNLPERLRVARERAGLSKTEVSCRLKSAGAYMSRQTITRLERGEREPTASQLAVLARVYQRGVSWFVEDGEPKPDPQILHCNPMGGMVKETHGG